MMMERFKGKPGKDPIKINKNDSNQNQTGGKP
jgi:hypothetical protein